jgi:hypothetical protein
MSATHVAGPVISIGGRIIQLCALCGEKLADSRNVMMPANNDGSAPIFPTWAVAGLVQQDGNRTSAAGWFEGESPLPADFCLPLVE